MDLPTSVISAVLQALLFSMPPFITYVVTRRAVGGFRHYVGLYACPPRALVGAGAVVVVTAPFAVGVYLIPSLREVVMAGTSVAARIAALEPSAETFAIILVVACVQTGLAEEVLFRGFIAKRLIAWLGFQRGNALQSAVFVLPHLLLFVGSGSAAFGLAGLAVATSFPAVVAWLAGWLNERRGGGSIVPGWAVHSAANVLAFSVALLI